MNHVPHWWSLEIFRGGVASFWAAVVSNGEYVVAQIPGSILFQTKHSALEIKGYSYGLIRFNLKQQGNELLLCCYERRSAKFFHAADWRSGIPRSDIPSGLLGDAG